LLLEQERDVIHSLLIGMAGGMRSMTPLAAVALAAHNRQLPRDNGAPEILSHTLPAMGAVALAVGEIFGDKMKSAPDRIIAPGMAARLVTGAIAGAALAPREDRMLGATLGAVGACVAAYLTFEARMRAMQHAGQTSTGLVEDAITLAATALIVKSAADSAQS
jgi:uncharacterized membrane protein